MPKIGVFTFVALLIKDNHLQACLKLMFLSAHNCYETSKAAMLLKSEPLYRCRILMKKARKPRAIRVQKVT